MRMLKRCGATIGLLVMMALTLSGCIHINRNVTLNSDGTGSYTLTIGYLDDLLSAAGASATDEMNQYGAQIKQQGGSYREYEQDSYTYWAYTQPFASVSKLNAMLGQMPGQSSSGSAGATGSSASNDTITVTEQQGALSSTFHVTGHLNLSIPAGTDTGGVDVSTYLKDMRDGFSVTMPGWVSAHSGGTVSGNTVSYQIAGGQQMAIDVTGGGLTTGGWAAIIVGVIVVLALIGLAIFFIIRRQRGQKPLPTYATPGSGSAPLNYSAPNYSAPNYSAPNYSAPNYSAPTPSFGTPPYSGQPTPPASQPLPQPLYGNQPSAPYGAPPQTQTAYPPQPPYTQPQQPQAPQQPYNPGQSEWPKPQ